MTAPTSASPLSSSVSETELLELIEAARRVRKNAYVPYSHYRVGAAMRTSDGQVFVGCNFENASYPAGICAERCAVGQMVASGRTDLVACAVVTGGTIPGAPCGICRQVMSEFARDMPVVLVCEQDSGSDVRRDTTLGALLPDSFDRAALPTKA